MKYAINGRFLTQRVTGVQRFAKEIVKALDNNENANDFCIVVPRDYDRSYKLENISIIEIGKNTGIIWEQTSFLYYILTKKLIGINLGNVAPLLKPDVVFIHDVKLVINPQWFNWKYVLWSKINYNNALQRGKLVITVSDFSKSEIERIYPKRKVEIKVVDEGWQHMKDISLDENALDKYGLISGEYYFSLYQSIPNKNFGWVINAAINNPEELFVVSGWNNKKTNVSEINYDEIEKINNIKILGFISDEEMKCLLSNCKAFLFPSLYEGFGLPPLEALSVGAHVMVMDIEVMKEVFRDSVQYLHNDKYDLKPCFIDNNVRDKALFRHSWVNGADKVVTYLNDLS